MFDTFTLETSTRKLSPRWQAAYRFARALRSHNFLSQKRFIDHIAERVLGCGIRFDPRTFRSEFERAAHFGQTRPGYNTRIAVPRGVPIFYRIGGRSGKQIVLIGALPPGSPLPPSERINAPQRKEVGSNFAHEVFPLTSRNLEASISLGEVERESIGTISGNDYIKWVQRSLNRLYRTGIPTDGKITSAYRAAVRRFNLEYTGRDYEDVDEQTQNNLIFVNEAPGPYVAWVVQALNASGFGPIPATDAYTPAIIAALKKFQASRKSTIKIDGFVGAKTELALIQKSGLLPPGEVKKRTPKPRPRRDDPPPEKRHRFIVVRGDTTDEVRSLALQSARAAFRAQKRLAYLAGLAPQPRRKEWNGGPEREWFGPYSASPNAHFGKVKRRIDLIAEVFRGRRNYNDGQRHDRVDLLTIESFDCAYPGDHVCNRIDPGAHPVLRWEKGRTPEERLRIEAQYHRKDRAYFCCHERETLGLAFRAKTRLDRLRDLIDLGMADRPHKIAICPGWFIPPTGGRLRRSWERERNTTIAHEVAHLAGAMKLRVGLDPETGTRVLINAEVYRPIGLRTLARIRPFLARINAENYAKYVMEFAKD